MLEFYQYITKDIISVLRFLCLMYLSLFVLTAIIFGGVGYLIDKIGNIYIKSKLISYGIEENAINHLNDQDND